MNWNETGEWIYSEDAHRWMNRLPSYDWAAYRAGLFLVKRLDTMNRGGGKWEARWPRPKWEHDLDGAAWAEVDHLADGPHDWAGSPDECPEAGAEWDAWLESAATVWPWDDPLGRTPGRDF